MITQQRLKELLDYDPLTGIFRWRDRGNVSGNKRGLRAGQIAGSENGFGYLQIKVDGYMYHAQRLVWLYVFGRFPSHQLDHINRDGLDNRIRNLREATATKNAYNRKRRSDNKSGVKGVYLHVSGKYRAEITVDGKRRSLGLFERLEDAASAYQKAAAEHHGEFARLL